MNNNNDQGGGSHPPVSSTAAASLSSSSSPNSSKNGSSSRSSTRRRRRPLRILLGVTGSVAAVKAPELAVRLVRELSGRSTGRGDDDDDDDDVEVRVLLTSGGGNFWNKASEYDPRAWREMRQLLETTTTNDGDDEDGDSTVPLRIHGTCVRRTVYYSTHAFAIWSIHSRCASVFRICCRFLNTSFFIYSASSSSQRSRRRMARLE